LVLSGIELPSIAFKQDPFHLKASGFVRKIVLAIVSALSLTVVSIPQAYAAIVVPAGNRNIEQPPIPGASTRRTKASNSSFERKFQKVIDLLKNDKALVSKIKSTSAKFGIDPIHMVGAIVGEHTYNVDAYDRLQSYYVKAASYAGNSFRFGYKDETIKDFLARPQFERCKSMRDSYSLWTCRETIWNQTFSGKTVEGTAFPRNRFSAVFFQPFYAGQTFGLGQINPLTALMLSDITAKYAGIAKLDENDAVSVYNAIMDPDKSLAYMAASIRTSIDDYRSVAGLDISKNPGVTATLYNVGGSRQRASTLAANNRQRAANGEEQRLPEENYYGWLINSRLPELQSLL
jgi:hypothetical protein